MNVYCATLIDGRGNEGTLGAEGYGDNQVMNDGVYKVEILHQQIGIMDARTCRLNNHQQTTCMPANNEKTLRSLPSASFHELYTKTLTTKGGHQSIPTHPPPSLPALSLASTTPCSSQSQPYPLQSVPRTPSRRRRLLLRHPYLQFFHCHRFPSLSLPFLARVTDPQPS